MTPGELTRCGPGALGGVVWDAHLIRPATFAAAVLRIHGEIRCPRETASAARLRLPGSVPVHLGLRWSIRLSSQSTKCGFPGRVFSSG
jgi:hypothetical protein